MDFSQTVAMRFKHIEFLLFFRGWLSRNDLMDTFGISEAAATRDFRHYKEICPENLELNQATKKWELLSDTFKPYFEHPVYQVFSHLRSQKILKSEGLDFIDGPPRLSLPDVNVLATLTRSISNKTAVRINYAAASRDTSEVEIVPHSLVDNGIRWHVRSYDRSRKCFWDFVLGRITSAQQIKQKISSDEGIDRDLQWNRIVRLELVPHPNPENLSNKESLAVEYAMQDNIRIVSVRAAIAGYWLRLWNVDCSQDHSEKGQQYQLWLKNSLALYDVDSATMAPGYKPPE